MAEGFEFHEGGVAADLSQFEEGVEDEDFGAFESAFGDFFLDAFVETGADGFVEFGLARVEANFLDDFCFGRQIGGDGLFGASEDEGSDAIGESLTGGFVAMFFDGDATGIVVCRFGSEEAWHEEVEEGPEFAQVIFDGGAAEAKAVAGV